MSFLGQYSITSMMNFIGHMYCLTSTSHPSYLSMKYSFLKQVFDFLQACRLQILLSFKMKTLTMQGVTIKGMVLLPFHLIKVAGICYVIQTRGRQDSWQLLGGLNDDHAQDRLIMRKLASKQCLTPMINYNFKILLTLYLYVNVKLLMPLCYCLDPQVFCFIAINFML